MPELSFGAERVIPVVPDGNGLDGQVQRPSGPYRPFLWSHADWRFWHSLTLRVLIRHSLPASITGH
ncbi:MAG: hypothetical protein ACRC46_03970 [Thermoguttaceae bacterium]